MRTPLVAHLEWCPGPGLRVGIDPLRPGRLAWAQGVDHHSAPTDLWRAAALLGAPVVPRPADAGSRRAAAVVLSRSELPLPLATLAGDPELAVRRTGERVLLLVRVAPVGARGTKLWARAHDRHDLLFTARLRQDGTEAIAELHVGRGLRPTVDVVRSLDAPAPHESHHRREGAAAAAALVALDAIAAGEHASTCEQRWLDAARLWAQAGEPEIAAIARGLAAGTSRARGVDRRVASAVDAGLHGARPLLAAALADDGLRGATLALLQLPPTSETAGAARGFAHVARLLDDAEVERLADETGGRLDAARPR